MLNREDMNIVIVGHVDHGKSTIIGRLFADTDSLPKGKLEQVKQMCIKNSKPFEYAFLLDALKDEQAQGITIDAARCFFHTQKRDYIIIDAPGHIEFLKNMVTGASRAEAALLVIDAKEGVKENSKRHGFLLSMLGIKQIVVLVNKIDLINYEEEKFYEIVKEYTEFLEKIDVKPKFFVPVSGMNGDNIAKKSEKTKWYNEKTVLEILDNFENEKKQEDKDFRMYVQDVYKFTKDGDNRRITAGTIETGKIKIGDEIVFYPSGKKSKIKTIEGFNVPEIKSIGAGYAAGFTLEEQIYLKRGELACISGENSPNVTTKIKANLFWLGKEPLVKNKKYIFKIGTKRVNAELEDIVKVMDASKLENIKKDIIEKNDVAECSFRLEKPIAFDIHSNIQNTSRFVLIDNYDIAGGGIISEALKDKQSEIRENVFNRNLNWEKSYINPMLRNERYNQKSTLILITGEVGTGRRDIARLLEKKLFETGKIAYYLGVENIKRGIENENEIYKTKEEHLRIFGEVSNLMIDSGMILIATIVELEQDDIEMLKTIINPENIDVVWIGKEITTDIKLDLHITEYNYVEDAYERIVDYMKDAGKIFNPFITAK